jgi:hypothetical protein
VHRVAVVGVTTSVKTSGTRPASARIGAACSAVESTTITGNSRSERAW